MLILTRKLDESIMIDNKIEVKILKVQGGQVHIGVDAPRSVSIHRYEIYEQIKSENLKAVQKTTHSDVMKNLETSLADISSILGGGSDE